MTRLGKAHVEALLTTYDATPVEALIAAMRIVFASPTLEWAELVQLADFPPERRARLLASEPVALDELAAELNELREVAQRPAARARPADRNRPL